MTFRSGKQHRRWRDYRKRASTLNGHFLLGNSLLGSRRVSGADFQHCQKGFLRYVHFADALHSLLAFLLFFQELAFARDISTVALGEYIFADSGNGFARDDPMTD